MAPGWDGGCGIFPISRDYFLLDYYTTRIMSRSHPVVERLQTVTGTARSGMEQSSFARAFSAGALSMESYVGYVRALAIVYGTLESAFATTSDPVIDAVRRSWPGRAAHLNRENDRYRRRFIRDVPGSIDTALLIAADIRVLSLSTPVALAGTLGALVQVEAIAPVDPSTCVDLNGILAEVSPDLDRAGMELIEESANTTCKRMLEIMRYLHPVDGESLQYTVSALNPESGRHAIPQDRAVLAAAIRATDRILVEYPYFTYRYGPRGQRYTDADGAWMATLPVEGRDSMDTQMRWLISFLSRRGIPALLLGRHLEILAEELTGVISFDPEYVEPMVEYAREIRKRRDLVVSAADRDRGVRHLLQATERSSGDFLVAEAVELLSAAVADESDGVDGATAAMLAYLADPRRFSLPWVKCIEELAIRFSSSGQASEAADAE